MPTVCPAETPLTWSSWKIVCAETLETRIASEARERSPFIVLVVNARGMLSKARTKEVRYIVFEERLSELFSCDKDDVMLVGCNRHLLNLDMPHRLIRRVLNEAEHNLGMNCQVPECTFPGHSDVNSTFEVA